MTLPQLDQLTPSPIPQPPLLGPLAPHPHPGTADGKQREDCGQAPELVGGGDHLLAGDAVGRGDQLEGQSEPEPRQLEPEEKPPAVKGVEEGEGQREVRGGTVGENGLQGEVEGEVRASVIEEGSQS